MECRANCGMCCIIPSIKTAVPGMPHGKPSGQTCINLDPVTLKCTIWGTNIYPKFCRDFQPELDTCGNSQEEAEKLLTFLESATAPS